MRNGPRALASAGAIALLLSAAPAYASPLTFKFTGTVDFIYDPFSERPAPWNGVQVGDPWTLTYTFETDTLDPAPGVWATYSGAILSYSLTVGPVSENALPEFTEFSAISVANNDPNNNPPYDAYEFYFQPRINLIFFLLLADLTGSSWSTTARPTDLNLAGFDDAYIMVRALWGGIWKPIN